MLRLGATLAAALGTLSVVLWCPAESLLLHSRPRLLSSSNVLRPTRETHGGTHPLAAGSPLQSPILLSRPHRANVALGFVPPSKSAEITSLHRTTPHVTSLASFGVFLGALAALGGTYLRANKEDYDNAQAWQYFLGNYQRPGKPKWLGGKQWAGYLPQKPDKIAPIYRSPNQDYDPKPRMPQWIDPDDTRTPEQRVLDKWNGSKWAELYTEHAVALSAVRNGVTYDSPGRMAVSDVGRLADALPPRRVPPGYPVRTPPPRLTPDERMRWAEAVRRGVVEIAPTKLTVVGRRPPHALVWLFRQHCDVQVRPCVSVWLGPLVPFGDTVEVDVSPLRLTNAAHRTAFFRICDAIAETLDCRRIRSPDGTSPDSNPIVFQKLDEEAKADVRSLAIVRLPAHSIRYSAPKRSTARRLARQIALFWNGELAKGPLVGFRYDEHLVFN